MAIDPDDPMVRTAVFGKQVEDFLHGEIGQYLVKRAEAEVEKDIEKLKNTSPLFVFAIMKLQHRIELWEGVQQQLADAIMDGQQAMRILEGDDE